MDISYKRELDQNYLVIEQEEFKENYQVGMLTENKIPGLLVCKMSRIDRRAIFSYEITSRQSLQVALEHKRLAAKELRGLLEGLHKTVQSCREYLLEINQILLFPEYIFLDFDSWEIFFCCLPFYEESAKYTLLELAEYLLEHLDRQDQEAVALGYEFYRLAGEENVSLEKLLGKARKRDEEKKGSSAQREVADGNESLNEKTLFTDQKESRKKEETDIRSETILLKEEKSEGLTLKSENSLYPDIRITTENFLIGKKKGAVDGWLKARGVSRIHGKISKENGEYYLTDLNSTNGTYLNGGRLEINEKARIRPGDCVGFADVEYVVDF